MFYPCVYFKAMEGQTNFFLISPALVLQIIKKSWAFQLHYHLWGISMLILVEIHEGKV